jgi:hypothetical protein
MGSDYYGQAPQFLNTGVSPRRFFPVERLLVFNNQTSQNVRISQYNVFRPMIIQEIFILTFQKLHTTFVTKLCACKLYMLLHKKQLLTNILIEICGLLGYYTASCGNYLPTFRNTPLSSYWLSSNHTFRYPAVLSSFCVTGFLSYSES